MPNYENLHVWKKSHELALRVHAATKQFPREELFGLTSQMRRSALSIPSNLAEGCGRDSQIELRRFVRIARGSAHELEYQLLFARDSGVLPDEQYRSLRDDTSEVARMLSGLTDSIGRDRK